MVAGGPLFDCRAPSLSMQLNARGRATGTAFQLLMMVAKVNVECDPKAEEESRCLPNARKRADLITPNRESDPPCSLPCESARRPSSGTASLPRLYAFRLLSSSVAPWPPPPTPRSPRCLPRVRTRCICGSVMRGRSHEEISSCRRCTRCGGPVLAGHQGGRPAFLLRLAWVGPCCWQTRTHIHMSHILGSQPFPALR